MNHIYKVIWNTITQTWVAVSELSRAKGKTKSSKTLTAVVLAAVSTGAVVGGAEAAMFAGQGDGISIQSQNRNTKVAKAEGVTAIAIGYDVSSKGTSALAIGTQTHATGEKTVAVGHLATATGSESAAFGVNATAAGNGDIALGKHAVAQGGANGVTGSAALGDEAHATGAQSAAVGGKSSASGTHTIASGYKAGASGENAAAFGADSTASGTNAASIGPSSTASGSNSAALGMQAQAKGAGSLAAGAAAQATKDGSTAVGTWTEATAEKTTALGDSAHATTNRATALGHDSQATGEFSTAAGVSSRASGSASVATGKNATASGANTIAIGNAANAAGTDSIATGRQAATTGSNAIATGADSSAANNASAYGNKAKATGGWSSAFGNESKAAAADASAFGNTATAAAQDSTAIGAHSSVTSVATGGTALGRSSSVTTAGGVALGQGSASTRAALDGKNITISSEGSVVSSNHITDDDSRNNNSNDVYAPVKLINDPNTLTRVKETIKGSAGAVSLGNGTTTRQLTNLAPGSADSDAVNVAQLKAVVGSIKKYTVTSPDGSITVTSPTSGQDPQNFQISMNTTAVKDAAAWKIKANKEADDKATSVRGGDIVTFKAKDGGNSGDTIKISRNGKELTFEANYATIRTPGTGTVNVDNGVKDNWLAKAKNVAEAINASGWTLQANGDNVGLVNPGDKVNIATDANSGITITPTNEDAHGVSTIKLKANVTGLTAGKNVTISSKDGNYTISATDTNTQASVSKKSGSPITVTKTTTTPNSPDYAVGLDIDDKTLEIKGGKLAAKTQAQAVESVEKKAGDDNIAEVDVKSGSTKGAANAVYTVAVTKSAVKDAAAWNIKEGSETTSTAVKGGDTLTLSDTNTIDVVHNGKDFTFNAKTATIQTEQKQAITKIDVSNEGITTKTTGGNNTPTGRFIVPTGNNADKHALATAYDVADKVNQTGWNLYTNGGAPILINPGDYVNFKSGKATNANIVTEASEGATISYDVNVDDTTIKIDPNGNKLTANTVDLTVNNGKVTKPSTDDGKKLVNATTVANAVNNSYWKATRGTSDETNADEGDATSNIKAGNELTFVAGKNMALKKAGNTFTYGTKDNVSFTTVTSNEFVVNPNGKFTVGAGSTINMGNNIVGGVANGVADTDAVNVAQLKANTSVVSAGDNITVTPSTNAEGNKVYTVAAKNTQATVSKAEGDNPITLDNSTTNANGTTNYKVGLNIDESTLEVKEGKLAAKAQTKAIETVESKEGGDNIAQVDVKSGKAKGDAGATYQVSVTKNDVKDVAKEAVDVRGSDFITVTPTDGEHLKTHTVAAKTGTIAVTETTGAVTSIATATGLVTDKTVADAIAKSGFQLKQGEETTAKTVINPGDSLTFKDGQGTKAVVNANGDVQVNANVASLTGGDNVTVKDNGNGSFTINAKDTNTQASVSKAANSPITINATGADNAKNYELDVAVDGTTIVKKDGKLTANVPDVSTTDLTVNNTGSVNAPNGDNGKKLVNATTVANAVNNSYWKATRGASDNTNDDKAEGDATSNIKAGNELTFVAGKNMALKKAGNTFTYGTKDNVSFTTVTSNEFVVNPNGKFTVGAGSTINMGNNIVGGVANGVADTDAVNVAQLKANTSVVSAGDNITVTPSTNAEGNKVYTVAAKNTQATVSKAEGDNPITLDNSTTNANGTTNYKVGLNIDESTLEVKEGKLAAKAQTKAIETVESKEGGDNIAQVDVKSGKAKGDAGATYQVSVTKNDVKDVAKEAVDVRGSDFITVTPTDGEHLKTHTVAAKTGTIAVTETTGAVTSIATATGLVTDKTVADAIAKSGFQLKQGEETTAKTVINPGDSLTFKDGQGTKAVVNANGDVQVNANVASLTGGDNVTVKDNGNGSFTINAKDTNTQASVSKAANSPITINATGADNAKNYELDVAVDGTTIVKKDGKLTANVPDVSTTDLTVNNTGSVNAPNGDNGKKLVNATTVANAVNNSYWKATRGASDNTNDDKAEGDATSNIKAGNELTFVAGKNMALKKAGNTFTYGTKDNVSFTTVTSNEFVVNPNGKFTVGAGSTINMGNNIVGGVANGVADTDAVNVAQLKANTSVVSAGDNITVTPSTNAEGNKVYTVAAKNTQATVSKAEGDNPITLDNSTTNANGTTNYKVGLNIDESTLEVKEGKLAAKAQTKAIETVESKEGGDNIAQVDVKSGKAKGDAGATYQVSVTKNDVKDVAKEAVDVRGSDFITVTPTDGEHLKTHTVAAKTGTIAVTETTGAVTSIATATGLVTDKTVADAIAKSGFQLKQGEETTAKTVINPGDSLTFKDGQGTKAVVNANGDVQVNANVASLTGGDNVTVKDNGNGSFTINAKDTNTQASVSKAANSPITINATGADNAKNYELDVAVDGTTIVKKDGKLTANVPDVSTTDLTVNNTGSVNAPNGDNGKKLVNATTVANAVNNSYWKATRGASDNTNDDKAEGDATSNIKAGNELTFVAGKNMALKKAGNTFTYGTKDNVSFTTVTSNEFVVNPNGKFTVGAGSTINMGNNIVGGVANGVADTDAVNVAQLKANTSVVSAGDNITVTPSTNAEGNKVYTVAAKNTQATVSKAEGDNPITLDNSTTNANGTTNYKVGLNIDESTLEVKEGKLAAKAQTKAIETVESKEGGDNIAQVDVKSGKAKGDAGATYQVSVTKNDVKDVAKEAVDVRGSDFITVTPTDGEHLKTHTVAAKTGTIAVTETTGAVTSIATATGLVTDKTVADAIAKSGFQLKQGEETTAKTVINPGDSLTFKDGQGTKAVVNANGDVQVNANVASLTGGDNVTVKDNGNGSFTINAKDTNTQASVSKAANSPITINATGADNAKNYELDVAVDGTTIVKKDGKLTANVPDVSTTDLTVNNTGSVNAPNGDNGKKLVNATTVANAVNNSYWKATRGASDNTNDDKAEGDATSNIKAGNELTFVAGKNMALKKAGNTFTYGTKDNVSFTTVTSNEFVVNPNGKFTVGAGSTINMGNNIVGGVANGVADTDAVNVAQLKANTSVVSAGDNITVTPSTNAEGNKVYTVAAKNTQATVSKAEGDNPITLDNSTTNANGTTNYKVGLNIDESTLEVKEGKLAAKAQTKAIETVESKEGGDNIAQVDVKSGKAKGDAGATYQVSVTKNDVKDVAKEAVDVRGSDFITVTPTDGEHLKTHTVAAKTGTIAVTETTGAVTSIATATGLVTDKTVADAIAKSGFQLKQGEETTAKTVINPGDSLTFKDGQGTKAVVNANGDVQVNANVASLTGGDNVTVKDNGNGSFTINAKDTNTQASVSKAANSPITINATGADNAKNYELDVAVDGTTIVKKDGKLTANVPDVSTTDLTVNNTGSVNAPNGDNGKKLVNATTVANAVNNSYWKATRGASDNTNDDKAEGDATSNIKAGNELTFVAGKNMALKKAGNTFTYGTKDNVSFTTVTSNEFVVNPNGKFTVGAGSTINMGNNIVGGVANGVADTDAVNVAQLKANTTTVVAGKNVSVDVSENASTGKTFTVNADKTTVSGTGPVSVKATSDAANHTTNYNVEFDSSKAAEQTDLTYKANGKDAKKVKLSEGLDFTNGKGTKASIGDNGKVTFDATVADVKQGDNVTINKDETTGVYTVNAKDTITTVKGKNGSAVKVTTATGSTDTNKIYEVDVNVDGKTIVNENGTLQAKGWKTKVVKGEGEVEGASEETVNGSDTVNYIAGKNVKLVQDGKNFTIATKDNVTFKDTTTTNLSVTPGGKVDMGNNKVTNVAEGTENTDAVNVKQLKDFKAEVADGGLTFAGNSGTAHKAKLNTTVNIKGGKDNTDATKFDNGKNVMTTVNGDTVTVSIKKTPEVEGINITDTTGNVKVKLTQTDEGLKVSDGNNNATRITNVKAGEKDTDAVNVKQLKAAKTEVEAGENIEITSRTDATNGQTIYKVSAKGINDTSAAVKGGSDHVKVTKAANTHKDGSTTVTDYTVDLSNKTKEDIKKGVDAHTEVTTKGLTFNADKGTTGVKKLGSKVSVNGDGKNITTTADENGVKVSMKDDIKVNSVTAKEVKVGNVNINENGINAGGKRITNVAPGKDGTDAVNVNQLKYVAGNISNQINNVDKGLRAGIAGALASGGLYHATTSGKSMVSVGAGTYRGQNALAVGYSRLSDNGKVGVKFTVNSNSQGHAGASASVGYQW